MSVPSQSEVGDFESKIRSLEEKTTRIGELSVEHNGPHVTTVEISSKSKSRFTRNANVFTIMPPDRHILCVEWIF